jgi:hypothetical protein
MKKKIIAVYLMLSIGAIITAIGAFIIVDYYQIEQWCALNGIPCPIFGGYILLGIPSIVVGLLIFIAGLIATAIMKRQSHLEKEITVWQKKEHDAS